MLTTLSCPADSPAAFPVDSLAASPDEAPPVGVAPRLAALESISAEDLHRVLVSSHVLGNRVRRRFLHALVALDASGLYRNLGFSSGPHYAEATFGFEHVYTWELLRVGRALADLPAVDRGFTDGVLSWSAVREITRVAERGTEEDWIRFAREHSVRRLRAEVQSAREKGRKKPRSDRYGLPELKVRVSFDLDLEEHERFRKGVRKALDEMGESLGAGAEKLELKDAMLFLAQMVLETDPAGVPSGRAKGRSPLYSILYHACTECRAKHLQTDDGLVAVPDDVVGRVEAAAEKVTLPVEEELGPFRKPEGVEEASDAAHEMAGAATEEAAGEAAADALPAPARGTRRIDRKNTDRKNTRSLVRRVLLRDGHSCTSPFCRRKLHLQAHHVEARAEGGPTVVWNEAGLCAVCHALQHAGYISLKRLADATFEVTRRVDELPGVAEIAQELNALERIPEVRVDSLRHESDPPRSGFSEVEEDVLAALQTLGFSVKEARRRFEKARGAVAEGEPPLDVEALLRDALR
jgi:hypothetical protein